MILWAREHKIIIDIYYPVIQFLIGLVIIVIQYYETKKRKQFFSEAQGRFYNDADKDKNNQDDTDKDKPFHEHPRWIKREEEWRTRVWQALR